MADEILLETRGRVRIITLNRPEAMNALCRNLRREFVSVFRNCIDDDNVRVIILTGAGKVFSAGGDLGMMSGQGDAEGSIKPASLVDPADAESGRLRMPAHLERLCACPLLTPAQERVPVCSDSTNRRYFGFWSSARAVWPAPVRG